MRTASQANLIYSTADSQNIALVSLCCEDLALMRDQTLVMLSLFDENINSCVNTHLVVPITDVW